MYHYVPNRGANAPRNAIYNLCADKKFARRQPEGGPPLARFMGNTMKGGYVGKYVLYFSNTLIISNNETLPALNENIIWRISLTSVEIRWRN